MPRERERERGAGAGRSPLPLRPSPPPSESPTVIRVAQRHPSRLLSESPSRGTGHPSRLSLSRVHYPSRLSSDRPSRVANIRVASLRLAQLPSRYIRVAQLSSRVLAAASRSTSSGPGRPQGIENVDGEGEKARDKGVYVCVPERGREGEGVIERGRERENERESVCACVRENAGR